ncbi:MAG: cysteine desulfurase NifS [Candidatus Aureabacteria bacterium]|nr:cysteine desulfurase NifS [Candidatus Auribacterota bacterium]
MKTVYLDNNATSRISPEVLEAMMPFLRDLYGNPSSMHLFGGQVRKNIDRARQQVANLLGADEDEIIFTGCGTESDNTAILSALAADSCRQHIVTTRVEHPAVLGPCKKLEKDGHTVKWLSVDARGMLDLDEARRAIGDCTGVTSVMYANNETGVIFPVEEVGAIAKNAGSFFHVDAIQAVGKIPLNMRNSTIDYLSLSGHKLHAPKGIAALYIRKGTKFSPLIIGGHQEMGRRGGTENVASIVGLGAACELARKYMEQELTDVKRLRDKLERALLAAAPDARLNGHPEMRLPNTSNISFEYVEGEAILLRLNELGICASSGSACTSGSLEPSHVLRAMGIPYTAAHGSIRFSLSRYTTEEEIDFVIEHVPPIIKLLRQISPFGRKTA